MIVRFLAGSPLGSSYSKSGRTEASTIDSWPAGTARDVDDDLGAYLLDTFPECFESDVERLDLLDAAGDNEPEPEPERPAFDAASVLSGTVAEVLEQVDEGTLDAFLEELVEAEEAGKARRSLLAGLHKRGA